MPWIYGLIGLLVGAIFGIIIARIKTPQYKKHKQMQKELDAAKFALEQQRQELADHFAHTSDMLDSLGKSYQRLYQHMETTASDMLPDLPEQDKPFTHALSLPEDHSDAQKNDTDQPPKDYAKGATGLFKGESKETLSADKVINAS
ncbi:DUF1043 domain-containing protein [Vibrio albus]|jgi:hypothetical protein|uniref:Z-ring associated protein G n=1 Tax=Vibrio albus TaxID=2200953 RepID=A0A2U3B5J0_9VIBR|nr:Z-ring associated protein ZapG [Vibrio albus]PWI31985.1 DUF1043 domain-containing protein [Vibrio albus]